MGSSSEIASLGHSSTQAPQARHSSVILWAMWFSSPPVGALRTQNAPDSASYLAIWQERSQDGRWASSGKSSMRARAAAPMQPASGPSAAALALIELFP